LCVDNPELNDDTGLLCSDVNDDEYVEQNVSSPDTSSEDDVSEEDIDDTPDCPITSGVQYEDGVALSGRSSLRLVVSQPVRADVTVASGSGQSLRGNKCLDEEDVQLLAKGYIGLPFYAGDNLCADNRGESRQPPACSRWTVPSPA